MKRFLTLFLLTALVVPTIVPGQTPTVTNLIASQKLEGFTTKAVYLNDAREPIGARFVHDRTGFTLDLLQIESAPQTFIWVNTPPVSDKGEPHTQEHLLLTKGNKGHELNTREAMSLTASNAFTSQIFTAYDFYTNAGGDVFYGTLEGHLDALLHPDYTDEEVHREVCNWGVVEDPASGKLRLEEKGSVYNEMKNTSNNIYSVAYNEIGRLIYGPKHPLSYNSGGSPEGIRVLNAAGIRAFHDKNYHLYNMGAIAALPKAMALATVLHQMDGMLNRLEPGDKPVKTGMEQPEILPAAAGTVKILSYPSVNAQDPGLMLFGLPADRKLSIMDNVMLKTFLGTFAGEPGTNLYKKFIDGASRELRFDAQYIYCYTDDHEGQPVYTGLIGVPPASLTRENAALVWQKVQAELHTIATWKDGSKELLEFNSRFKVNLVDYRRGLAKLTNTPPLFGGRNTGDGWYQQLLLLNDATTTFKKSVTFGPQFEEIEAMLGSGKNFWGACFEKWKLMNPAPVTVLAKPDMLLLAQQDSEARARAAAEVGALKTKYKVADDQEAIQKYRAEYDANTLVLEKAEQSHVAKFIDNPPLTFDDQLDYKSSLLAGNVPFIASTFNNMTGATTGLALKLNKLPADKLVYLAMLPELLTQTGLYKNDRAMTYEDMSQLQRKQILSLNAWYTNNARTGRSELQITGAGNNKEESVRAVQWMNDILQYPYWKNGNLPRIRDLINQNLSNLRKTMQGSEESWVSDPGLAYRAQHSLLLLSSASFLTRLHNVQRLRWMFMDGGDADERLAATNYLQQLAKVKGSRADLMRLLAMMRPGNDTAGVPAEMAGLANDFKRLPGKARKTAEEAAKDLEQTLNDIPDESLQGDWTYLCLEMKQDLAQTAERTFADLEQVRKTILHTGNARIFIIGSSTLQAALTKDVNKMLDGLSGDKQEVISYPSDRLVEKRYQLRTGSKDRIFFAGLINPNSATGVFINSAPLLTYKDTAREQLLQYLAGNLFGGGGRQSVYTKSIGAGLSYSTGVRVSPGSGLFSYYAERTPLLPQTLAFIINEIRKTPDDPAMREYIISLAFGGANGADPYEDRGESIAADLADGLNPETVRTFRKAILKLRNDPSLMAEVFQRKDRVYEKILPGYGAKMGTIPGGCYFVIGPEKQLAAYESYLQSKEGKEAKVARIYPRDFWME